ncbi:MAG: TlpA disulfide reductase family protein [Planctomycetota bacterium]
MRPFAVICLVLTVALPGLAIAENADRYRLEPGHMLTFESSTTSSGAHSMRLDSKHVVYVLDQTQDDAWWVMVVNERSYNQGPASVDADFCTIYADGRIEGGSVRSRPYFLFPLLPDVGENDWEEEQALGTVAHYERRESEPGALVFSARNESPTDGVYDVSSETVYRFDRGLGLIMSAEGESRQGYPRETLSTTRLAFAGLAMVAPDRLVTMREDAKRLAEFKTQAQALIDEAHGERQVVEEVSSTLDALIAETAGGFSPGPIAEQFEQARQQYASWRDYAIENAERQSAFLDKPAADWTLDDLSGQPHRLADYRGRVVVLDFWYRGCGWCIYAMPQINELAEAYAEQPVAVLGMNKDLQLDDALLVEEQMQLAYPSLQINQQAGLPEKYGVRGYPTLVIIDQDGVVREYHVGYAPDLFEQVSATIDRLLGESAGSAPDPA